MSGIGLWKSDSSYLLPSGKRLHCYRKSPCYWWLNQGFLWQFSIATSTLQILEKYRCLRNLTYIDWFYPKHLDTTLVFDFRTLIAWFWAWWDKGQKMFAAHQTTREKTRKTPQKNRKKTAKTHKKNAKTRKSWNLVVLGSFRIFLLFQKSSRLVYPAVVLRFSQKHTCLEQSESFVGLFDLSS